jgi:hypothetical protein
MGAKERWIVLREVEDATRDMARERAPTTATEVLKDIILKVYLREGDFVY